MEKNMAYLHIDLKGNVFQPINDQYFMELERINASDHMLYSKMGDIYTEVFKCNESIKLLKAECFGDILIDDNHIEIEWDIGGCKVEFYYEQYWDIMNLTIGLNNSERAMAEIVKAFQNYYNKIFTYQFSFEDKSHTDSAGKIYECKIYHLTIEGTDLKH